MRSMMSLVLVLALVAPAFAAEAFSDVPKTHWGFPAIQQAVDAGILQGYDGKFHGQRLLNRYQMAVIVAKLLDAVKTPGGKAAVAASPKGLAGVEALTIEFADELALLNVKVSTLEDTCTELKNDVAAMKTGTGAVSGSGLGFTAFAQVGLISTDKRDTTLSGVGPFSGLSGATRYGESADSLFFTLPQASIGIDKEVNPGVYFHAQFDYASDVNGPSGASAGSVGINEAYFFVDEMLGDIGGKVGAFALPFSMEHNGPFRTCNYTITPSMVNTFNEGWRGYGVEFQRTKDVKPEDIMWKVGIVSGTDYPQAVGFTWTDAPVRINGGLGGERDDSFGYYLFIGKKPEKKGFGWNLSYFTNGGDATGTPPPDISDEIKYWQVGFEWWGDKLGVLAQYLDGSWQDIGTTTTSDDFTAWYLLVNFEINDKNNVSLRYDDANVDVVGGEEITGITFAFNHKVTENSLFQFEYLTADNDVTNAPTFVDPEDDIIQLRYKVHF